MTIYDIIAKAESLQNETAIGTVTPERVGSIIKDSAKYINEAQIFADALVHRVYRSVDAFYAESTHISDLTGRELKPGQLVWIIETGTGARYDGENQLTDLPIVSSGAISLTYQQLVDRRDAGKLVAGCYYRITDYVTTTVQENTQSAGHQFDVVVMAVSNNSLAERAWAILHEGDTYFAKQNLSAWQIWYSLDNETTRYMWADSNGKGVIYRMIDERGNECPYDFKNIQYSGKFTFGGASDDSLNAQCYGNVIKPYVANNKYKLNGICCSPSCYNNVFEYGCHDNTLGYSCRHNIFGATCFNNTLLDDCYSNTFGDNCYGNSLNYECRYNIFGGNCLNNSLGYGAYNNTLDSGCYNNTLGSSCSANAFYQYCHHIVLDDSCESNVIMGECYYVSFPVYSVGNILDCRVRFVDLINEDTASYNQLVQHYHITAGVIGSSPSERLALTVERGRAYETTVAITSSGEVKQFCLADIIL